jgi:Pro-kumamolisin, activation domain/Bacterial Ig-like domain (group 3)
MRRNRAVQKFLAAFVVFLALPILASAQTANVHARITQPVDDTILALLKGNTHPLARAEFDRGAAPAGMPLHRMLLSLKRSPAQESALQQLLIDLQDKSSLNYHKWLTPAQFGQQFGASDEDIQAITSWLGSHGFQVANVSSGRTVIEFSGTVGQVQQAFHTAIHKYVVNGEEHWANSSDPQIPTALVPVVAGVSTLHNFVKHPHYKTSGARLSGTSTGGPRPAVNLQGCKINANPCPAKDQFIFHALGPGDFATIYNTPTGLNIKAPAQQFNGDGVTIAIVARSNINTSDVQEFRNIFGLSSFTGTLNVILDGPDPGNLGGGEEIEAVLDATWSGSVAPNAAVDFVVSESTETTDGIDLSEVFIIDNNLAPVMSESFGQCEQDAGSAQATNESNLAEQAAAQGITFMASTGDAGAEGCDDPHLETIAKGPIAVGIPAALPFTVAVGGTMFTQNDAAFWNANNSNTFESANSYIPEDVWNESCATQSSCLASVTSGGGGPNILAGSGGASIIFPKPAFQSGVTGLSGANREVPDVALNAAVFHDPTVLCVDDQLPPGGCANPGNFFILPVGGTSVASPSFAGIMALVNQATGERQGEAGFVLYKLAAAEVTSPGLSACNASTGNGPTGTTCVFNDVTSGNNAVPGETGFGTAGADFQAGIGYDEASGLGSVNVTNLINMWNTARSVASHTSLVISTTPAPQHGTSVPVTITVTGNGGTPTGDVSLIASTGTSPSGQTGNITLATMTLTAGVVSTTTSSLPGGNYTITAHYEGDGIFLPSDSAPVSVTVNPEPSKVQILFETFALSGQQTSGNATTAPYGANTLIRMNVTSSSASGGTCSQNTVGETGCPTGTVTLKDNGNGLDGSPQGSGAFVLNSIGYAEDRSFSLALLSVGSHPLTATYPGDNSFSGSNAADTITITQATPTMTASAFPTSIASGGAVTLTAVVNTQSLGAAPTGTVQFFNGATLLSGTVSLIPVAGSVTGTTASLTATLSTTLSFVPPANVSPKTPGFPKNLLWIVVCTALLVLLLLMKISSSKRRSYAYVGILFIVLLTGAIVGCGGGGGGGGGGHNDTITAKYSGDTNYAASQSTVTVNVQ